MWSMSNSHMCAEVGEQRSSSIANVSAGHVWTKFDREPRKLFREMGS